MQSAKYSSGIKNYFCTQLQKTYHCTLYKTLHSYFLYKKIYTYITGANRHIYHNLPLRRIVCIIYNIQIKNVATRTLSTSYITSLNKLNNISCHKRVLRTLLKNHWHVKKTARYSEEWEEGGKDEDKEAARRSASLCSRV